MDSDANSKNSSNKSQPPSSRASFADLFLRLFDPAFLIDPETFEIVEFNDACERQLGFPRQKMLGLSLLELFHSEDREEAAKNLRISRRRYHPREFEARWVAPSHGVRHMRVSAGKLALSDGSEVIQVVAHDISSERAARDQIHRYILDLRALNERLETLSITDEMTGLSNFRHFKTMLENEHQRSLRFKRPYALIFIDVDHFKNYNDHNGHPVGDALLSTLGALLRETCRKTDYPARYGGEEFVILVPEQTTKEAMLFAERLRKKVESTNFPHGDSQPLGRLTISIGVASYPGSGASPDEILEKADQALYESKRSGRNRVTSADALPVDPKKAA